MIKKSAYLEAIFLVYYRLCIVLALSDFCVYVIFILVNIIKNFKYCAWPMSKCRTYTNIFICAF